MNAASNIRFRANPGGALTGRIRVPGDKSISHRSIMLGSLADGITEVSGFLEGEDSLATLAAFRAMGVHIEGPYQGHVRIHGVGLHGLKAPTQPLYLGNSGTSMRLLAGLLAGQAFDTELTGDASLSKRPMRRVTEPLSKMGAHFTPPLADHLPIEIRGGRLGPLEWQLPVSSAQLKSALLLAGLAGNVRVAVREPAGLSRDHTERMLRGLGFRIETRDGWIVLEAGGAVPPFDLSVPGDPSSAAFLVGAGLIGRRAVSVGRVGLNPTRIGFLDVLRRMGARVAAVPEGVALGEPFGALHAEPGILKATVVQAEEIAGLIDEIPLLAVLAARAEGETRFEQVGELRVKESDRLARIADNLTALGYRASGAGNTLTVQGSDHPPRGRVVTDGDHRIAMAFAVLGTVPGGRVGLDDRDCVAVSFPGFFEALARARGGR